MRNEKLSKMLQDQSWWLSGVQRRLCWKIRNRADNFDDHSTATNNYFWFGLCCLLLHVAMLLMVDLMRLSCNLTCRARTVLTVRSPVSQWDTTGAKYPGSCSFAHHPYPNSKPGYTDVYLKGYSYGHFSLLLIAVRFMIFSYALDSRVVKF